MNRLTSPLQWSDLLFQRAMLLVQLLEPLLGHISDVSGALEEHLD
jgi:hypothetical protein